MCYTCVRECPAKAIRVVDGQASVIQERCIGCGNCVRVCSQNAKQVRAPCPTRSCCWPGPPRWPPSWPPASRRSSPTCDTGTLVAMLRALGFAHVHEVSFGADLVAARVRAAARRRRRRPLDRHHLSGRRELRAQVPPRPSRPPRAHRLADDRHRPGAARHVRARGQGRLHRPVHRQERRGLATSSSPARWTRSSPSSSCGSSWRPTTWRWTERPTTTSTRPRAAWALCSPSPAACCRRRGSPRTCSPARS